MRRRREKRCSPTVARVCILTWIERNQEYRRNWLSPRRPGTKTRRTLPIRRLPGKVTAKTAKSWFFLLLLFMVCPCIPAFCYGCMRYVQASLGEEEPIAICRQKTTTRYDVARFRVGECCGVPCPSNCYGGVIVPCRRETARSLLARRYQGEVKGMIYGPAGWASVLIYRYPCI